MMNSLVEKVIDICLFATFFRNLAAVKLDSIREYEVIHLKKDGRLYSENSFNSIKTEKIYSEKINFDFFAFKKYYKLNLYRNKQLMTPEFEIFEQNSIKDSWTNKRGSGNCYYQGYIGNDTNSTAVVANTCNGLHSYIRDRNGLEYVIEPFQTNKTKLSDEHIFYRINRTVNNFGQKCGVRDSTNSDNIYTLYDTSDNSSHTFTEFPSSFLPIKFGQSDNNFERRRVFGETRNKKKYISVIVILDHGFYRKYGEKTEYQVLGIMNNVDHIYKYLNSRVAVQALMIWRDKNLIDVTADAGKTLDGLETYSHDILFGKMDLNADSIVLITSVSLDEHIVGLAGVGTMCSSRPCALIEAYSDVMVKVANTVAHEIGHTLGFQHNTKKCKCSQKPCVMKSYAPSTLAEAFSDCSQNMYEKRLDKGQLTCLFDYPRKLYGKPKCGNGFLEDGEACDCGSKEECIATGDDKCCDAGTCTLQKSAKCASGECCKNCQFKTQATLCRKAYDTDCDLPEYCTGVSQHCPTNTYVMDGNSCAKDQGSCFHGSCKDMNQQCQMLWGPNAIAASTRCFNLNTRKNDSYANCGGKENHFKECAPENMYCGKIQCTAKDNSKPLPIYPIIGEERGGRGSKIVTMGDESKCNMAYVPFEKDMQDPSMVNTGSKCGIGKMCQQQKCKNTTEINQYQASCKEGCFNGGVCNNKGNCHCPPGYACPDCRHLGLGGSRDSGQGCVKMSALSATAKTIIGTCTALLILIGALAIFIVKKREFLKAYREELRIRWFVSRAVAKPAWTIPKGRTDISGAGATSDRSDSANKHVTSSQNDIRIDVRPPPIVSISDTKGSKLTVADIKNIDSTDSVPPIKMGLQKSPKSPLKLSSAPKDGSRTPSPTPVFKINPIKAGNKKRPAPQPVKTPSPLPPKKALPPEPQNDSQVTNNVTKSPKLPPPSAVTNSTSEPKDFHYNLKPVAPNWPPASPSNDVEIAKPAVVPRKPLIPPGGLKPKLAPVPNQNV